MFFFKEELSSHGSVTKNAKVYLLKISPSHTVLHQPCCHLPQEVGNTAGSYLSFSGFYIVTNIPFL